MKSRSCNREVSGPKKWALGAPERAEHAGGVRFCQLSLNRELESRQVLVRNSAHMDRATLERSQRTNDARLERERDTEREPKGSEEQSRRVGGAISARSPLVRPSTSRDRGFAKCAPPRQWAQERHGDELRFSQWQKRKEKRQEMRAAQRDDLLSAARSPVSSPSPAGGTWCGDHYGGHDGNGRNANEKSKEKEKEVEKENGMDAQQWGAFIGAQQRAGNAPESAACAEDEEDTRAKGTQRAQGGVQGDLQQKEDDEDQEMREKESKENEEEKENKEKENEESVTEEKKTIALHRDIARMHPRAQRLYCCENLPTVVLTPVRAGEFDEQRSVLQFVSDVSESKELARSVYWHSTSSRGTTLYIHFAQDTALDDLTMLCAKFAESVKRR